MRVLNDSPNLIYDPMVLRPAKQKASSRSHFLASAGKVALVGAQKAGSLSGLPGGHLAALLAGIGADVEPRNGFKISKRLNFGHRRDAEHFNELVKFGQFSCGDPP